MMSHTCQITRYYWGTRWAWIPFSNQQRQDRSPHNDHQIPPKTMDADVVTCALLLSIPGVWRVNLQCGRAVSACIRAHTPVCSASRHPSRPPHNKPHTLLQFIRSSSHRPSRRFIVIACYALQKTISLVLYHESVETRGYDKIGLTEWRQKPSVVYRLNRPLNM